eukprot:gnl/TRDRNA2_/TRDRNA2_164217_c0_seq3.p1 gnl/TRDRNA2_/TRDRNA2_164217_c0~~gnl/TRDRNA2_/TRDRNA2_164217_c0_seq3.p1  ORF type:complete len:304 (+),score=47.05 gnl/TRDRNA2_/TRDRNA2_164217_c0_seq3:115-912(+)
MPPALKSLTRPFRAFGASQQVAQRKAELLKLVAPLQRGIGNSPDIQSDVVRTAKLLIETKPAPVFPAAAPQVEGAWELLWTTEKETLFLLEKGLPSAPSTGAYQILSFGDVPKLVNLVSFENDSELRVDSSTQPIDGSQRVDFQFTSAAITWRGFRIPVPPVGKGWFETVYVDDDLRIAFDIRGDTLICRRAPPEMDLVARAESSEYRSLEGSSLDDGSEGVSVLGTTMLSVCVTASVALALLLRCKAASFREASEYQVLPPLME